MEPRSGLVRARTVRARDSFFATEWPVLRSGTKIAVVDLVSALAGLNPLEQQAVALVYFEQRTFADAARMLTVEPAAIAAALTVAFRVVCRWVLTDNVRDGAEDRAVDVTVQAVGGGYTARSAVTRGGNRTAPARTERAAS